MGTVTELLVRWNDGDREALDELTTLTYDELRKLARAHLRSERPDHILQPTALVHAVYAQLIPMKEMSWQCRTQFYGMVTRMMRNILVDHARRRLADKRSGNRSFITLDKADRFIQKQNIDLLELNTALELLAANYPEHSKVVELRFFGGMTIEETAEVVGLSHATVERHWNFARAWLRKEMTR
ncbi:MAG TPA: ECF-type sigma factor [Pyrinomonadaceae bacterium]|nr:ECF-type sigma factor [Pyrinomonadaceae bacterium]